MLTSDCTRRYLVVIADYRLVPQAKFPDPMEDIRDAILWVIAHPTLDVPPESSSGPASPVSADTQNIFVMGHSAGAHYTSALMLHPTLLPAHVRTDHLRGLVLKGGLYDFVDGSPFLREGAPVVQLYGSADAARAQQPLALLREADDALVRALPDVVFFRSEWEPTDIVQTNEAMTAEFGRRVGREVRVRIMRGHNHVSPEWCLMSGEGEDWAVEVDAWIKERIKV